MAMKEEEGILRYADDDWGCRQIRNESDDAVHRAIPFDV